MVFPIVMYACESWTVKKAECWRIDAFELWCWIRLLRVPWTARRSNRKSVLNIHWKDWCWSWNSTTLATSCEELTQLKRPWLCEWLKAWGERDDRGWDGWMALLTGWTWVCVGAKKWWWTGRPGFLQSLGSQRASHNWASELNWTERLYEIRGKTRVGLLGYIFIPDVRFVRMFCFSLTSFIHCLEIKWYLGLMWSKLHASRRIDKEMDQT